MSRLTVLWMAPIMGAADDLRYWTPIVARLVSRYPNARFWTCSTDAAVPGTQRRVERAIPSVSIRRHVGNDEVRVVSVPSPTVLLRIRRARPSVMVASEFGLLSLYAAILRRVSRRTRLLLLVENAPEYLRGSSRTGWAFTALRRFIAGSADVILGNNDAVTRYLGGALKVPRARIRQGCYLTSETEHGASRAARLRAAPGEALRLLFVGRLVAGKGVLLMLDALEKVLNARPGAVNLEIVGDGPDRVAIEARLAASPLLAAHVSLAGLLAHADVAQAYRRADVFVFPTLGDYRALVGFEAVSAGLPVIGSIFDGAAPELIEEGVNGFVVDPRDTDALAGRIAFFSDRPGEVPAFAAASLRIAAGYTVDVAVANIVDAIESCVG